MADLITLPREVLEQAIEALEWAGVHPAATITPTEAITALRTALEAAPAAQKVEPTKYLANGTRFKMSFFQNEDGEGGYTDGTHVTCFESFEDELDGRWVALVAAENDCHLAAPAAREPLTAAQINDIWEGTAPYYDQNDFARAIEAAHGIGKEQK